MVDSSKNLNSGMKKAGTSASEFLLKLGMNNKKNEANNEKDKNQQSPALDIKKYDGTYLYELINGRNNDLNNGPYSINNLMYRGQENKNTDGFIKENNDINKEVLELGHGPISQKYLNTNQETKPTLNTYCNLKNNSNSYSVGDKNTWFDSVLNGINSITPEQPYEYAPKGFSVSTETTNDMIVNNELALEKLPRKADGSFDVEKIKSSLKTSTDIIATQNKEAEKLMEYGVYREAINNTSLLVALCGPELAKVITTAGGDNIPNWAKEGVSIFDVDINKLLDICEEYDIEINDGIKEAIDFASVKSSVEIKKDIKAQNDGLAALQNMDIKSEEDAKKFLETYSELTGTSFFCDKIDNCKKVYDNPNSSEKDKIDAYQKACGFSKNLTEAQKNQVITNIAYNVGVKYLIPVAINKINNPVAKIVSTALPTAIEGMETATKGAEEDEYINVDNLSYDNLIEILSDGAVDGLFVNLAGMNLFSSGKSGFLSKMSAKGKRTGAANLLKQVAKGINKAHIPNYSSWGKAALTTFIPGSGLFFDW